MSSTPSPLKSAELRALRARAHALVPVVIIGHEGLTESVMREIGRSLDRHELIKIRASGSAGDAHAARNALLKQVCDELNAVAVQHIGRILVVYRENPELHGAGAKDDATKKSAAKDRSKSRRLGPRRTKRSHQR